MVAARPSLAEAGLKVWGIGQRDVGMRLAERIRTDGRAVATALTTVSMAMENFILV